MGFQMDKAVLALQLAKDDLQQATNMLLEDPTLNSFLQQRQKQQSQ